MTRQDFVNKYGGFVKAATAGTGIFPETLFAQAIIESSDSHGNLGASPLAAKYNNWFGIKANKAWKGKSVNMKTGEYTGTPNATIINDYFRAYDSVEDSIKDYVNFLKGNSRYASAGVFSATSPQQQGQLLQKAGYATGAGYGNLIGNVASDVHKYLGNVEADFTALKEHAEKSISEATKKGIEVIKTNPVILIAGTVLILLGIGMFYKYSTQETT